MKLLAEIHDPLNLISEGEGDNRKHYLSGLRLQFDGKENKNHRIYKEEWHDPAVHSYIVEKMNTGRGWGELDHPDGTTINLKNVCQRMTEMHKESGNWFGKSIIVDNAVGQLVLGLLNSGGTLGSSSRGVGTLKQLDEAVLEVQKDFKLITPSDIVSDPSAHGALMTGIMENVEYFWDDKLGPVAQEIKNKVNKMSMQEIEDKKIAIFESFINKIKEKNSL